MEEAKIRDLLERYWKAETTLEEERLLAEYFRRGEVARDLEAMRGVFEWREEEAGVKVGADFDSRMLRRIGEMEVSAGQGSQGDRPGLAGRVNVDRPGGMDGQGGKVVGMSAFRFAAAAAIILCLGIGLLIPVMAPRTGGPVAGTAVNNSTVENNGRVGNDAIRDTYTDPNQALAAVRKALLVASARINEGRRITQKNITRLHDSWQAATGD
ncbi:MAG TPA: hypothetical protein VFE32_01035 [Puia sp.]|jgi:hypothetical protein|nr:hypothetical protein [Puia sp.]